MGKPPTAVDLFAGAGGASVGLTAAGFVVRGAIENDPDAATSYALNHPATYLDRRDIRDVEPAGLLKQSGLSPGDLTLLKSCPPCQGFSSLGAQVNSDPRNDLVAQTWRFATELRPEAVLVENVPGLRRDARFEEMVKAAEASGFGVVSFVVDAVQFGVPQHRKRLIMIAIRGLVGDRFSESPLDLISKQFGEIVRPAGPALSVAGALNSSDPLHRARTPRPTTLKRIEAIPVGGSRFDLPDDQQLPCHQKLPSRSATASYGRIRLDEPAPTMTTRCTTPACGRFIHPTEHRGLTLREAALLQTFPTDYEFAGGYDSVERQIGNAVPALMAEGLGDVVLALLRRRDKRHSERSRVET